MSDRNRDDYFNLDNFDDSIDSREYRRRQPNRRQTSYNSNPSYNRRRPSKRRNRTRTRNRILIVVALVLVVALIITLIVVALKGCGGGNKTVTVSTEPKSKQTDIANDTPDATEAPAGQGGDSLALDVFKKANPTDNNSDGYEAGGIYVWNQTGFELFYGTDDGAEIYADTINTLADKLVGMNVYSLMIPNHTEMGLPERFSTGGTVNTTSQADHIKHAYEKMDKTKVTPINAYNYLSEHCNDYIYFNSDHHWTGLGSYYAYKAFADTLGMNALSLSDCTEKTIEGFTGSLTNNADGLKTDTVHYWHFPYSVSMEIHDEYGGVNNYDSPYFDGEAGGGLAYGVFIYGDNPLTVMKSASQNAESGKRIAVVKESYGNAFVPYLTQNYEEVHVVDMRSFKQISTVDLASYCRQNGITDVLFLNGVMSANNGDLLDDMEGLFQ